MKKICQHDKIAKSQICMMIILLSLSLEEKIGFYYMFQPQIYEYFPGVLREKII